jgi:hypothetical protein
MTSKYGGKDSFRKQNATMGQTGSREVFESKKEKGNRDFIDALLAEAHTKS